jgi:putative transposase
VIPSSLPVRCARVLDQRFLPFADLLAAELDPDVFARLRAAESIGRPLGDDQFLARIERATSAASSPQTRTEIADPGKCGRRKLIALSP